MRFSRLSALALLALSAETSAQAPKTLVLEGDLVPGVGLVTRVDNLAVNDLGQWAAELDTNHVDTDADSVVLRDGALYLREGQALSEPAGATLGSFDALTFNDAGDSLWNLFLDGTATIFDDSGVYFGDQLLFQEGSISSAPELTPGTSFQGFFETKLDDAGAAIVLATVDDPAIATSVDQVMLRLALDGSGQLLAETALFKEGDVLPGQTEAISTFGTSPHQFAWSGAGVLLFFADLAGDSASDGVIYQNGVELAQEGDASPVPGRAWSSLASPELDLNDFGGHVYSGSLDGDSSSNLLIVRAGQKFRQEGDGLADIGAGNAFTSFGSGPLRISNAGDVLWFGDWDDPDTDIDTGLFIDDELLVQEGVTSIAGSLVDELRGIQDGYALSENGRYLVFEAQLVGGIEGVFWIDRARGMLRIDGCTGINQAELDYWSGGVSIGDTITLALTGAASPGDPALLGLASASAFSFPPCGLPLPGIGEVLLDVSPPFPFVLPAGAASLPGAPPPQISLTLPNNPNLVGSEIWLQGGFLDVQGVDPQSLLRMSNAQMVRVQP